MPHRRACRGAASPPLRVAARGGECDARVACVCGIQHQSPLEAGQRLAWVGGGGERRAPLSRSSTMPRRPRRVRRLLLAAAACVAACLTALAAAAAWRRSTMRRAAPARAAAVALEDEAVRAHAKRLQACLRSRRPWASFGSPNARSWLQAYTEYGCRGPAA